MGFRLQLEFIAVKHSEQPEQYFFRVPANDSMRAAATSFLTAVCSELEVQKLFTAKMTHHVVSAFTEAYTNVVKHAYRDTPSNGEISVEVNKLDDCLEILISDSGNKFEFEKVPSPDLDALPEGGMGIYIMKQFMENVTYSQVGSYNQLRMRKAYIKEKAIDAQH